MMKLAKKSLKELSIFHEALDTGKKKVIKILLCFPESVKIFEFDYSIKQTLHIKSTV